MLGVMHYLLVFMGPKELNLIFLHRQDSAVQDGGAGETGQ